VSNQQPDNQLENQSEPLPEPTAERTGRLLKYHSNYYYVEADGILYECMLRGLLKKEGLDVLVGDFVVLDSINEGAKTARVQRVTERKNTISRPKLANVDQVIVVYSLREPQFDPNQMDRYLTHIELAGLEPILCISKADLAATPDEITQIERLYGEKLGYRVVFTSVHQPDRIQNIQSLVQERITVLAGPSGSGKSSLLNALNPNFQLRVGEVSAKIARGQHTTRHVELLALNPADPHTLIADTPGFSNLKFNTVLPTQLAALFRDFQPYKGQCAFSDCLHVDEEGCAVLAHREEVADSRYQSYLDMLAEARVYKEEAAATSQKQEFGYKQLDRKGKEALQILRLKEKNRDASRRTQKQQVRLLDLEESEDATDEIDE
jgi:ribosome biogenesis GTPase